VVRQKQTAPGPVSASFCAFQPCLCHLFGGQAARRETTPTGTTVTGAAGDRQASDLTGKQLGNYRILAGLARAAWPRCTKAISRCSTAMSPSRCLAAHFGLDEEFRARLQREAAAIARLRPSHIVPGSRFWR